NFKKQIIRIPNYWDLYPDINLSLWENIYSYPNPYYWDKITPYDLKRLINPFKSSSWLQGSLYSIDFILTDPLGRQLGYTRELGFFNEIPNLLYTANNISGLEDAEGKNAPLVAKPTITKNLNSVESDPCSPEEKPPEVKAVQPISEIFQFFIFDRLPGEYKIEQIGRSQNSKSTIGNGTNTVTTTLDTCQSNIVSSNGDDITQVPEPSSILGLIALGLLGTRVKKRR
ncbi:MAG: PEP-CTERM sorting domain-containing protein, partial [Cyanobacteria bacterium P01_E01_bin.42]